MRVAMIGVGKLGLPVAVSMAMKGHDVMGYDLDASRMTRDPQPYQETGPDGKEDFNPWLAKSTVKFGTLQEVIDHAEIIFVAVQTPHAPLYEGITPLPDTRVDFDYEPLKASVRQIMGCIEKPEGKILSIISTVLPGTIEREIVPIVNEKMLTYTRPPAIEDTIRIPAVHLAYNPSFIAMGTTMRDFLDPEFVLIGGDDTRANQALKEFYATITDAPAQCMSIASAEMTKVTYNTFISLKIAFANSVMEACDVIPTADCDDVVRALSLAKRRVVSSAYLSGGMGDGGGCHPRDNIALSWFAQTHNLSFDLFECAMRCREEQARWLTRMLYYEHHKTNLPVAILGVAFKPETNLVIGSPALLVENLLRGENIRAELYDSDVAPGEGLEVKRDGDLFGRPAVVLIGCKHERYRNFMFASGSVVIDPHRYIPHADSYTVLSLGSTERGTPER